ncbi:bifunctional aminoglycoside phosphotransferase/ATP-binding protein [Leptolyngbya iicbica]|uniref:gluconokinase n=2 Tax=Cyanophyceae TaxID=3028117 RepID=A0A4Q7EGH0_9CYAN|nr:bifunctional aminoglycoside phosphotransferase/ATP-binding protein [Leptolyngbya sp. LK]RZM82372.1 adenylyl-sulfate kinase [Leptolyngbya sp. LK]
MADVSLPPLIEQMLQPEFYAHQVETPIRLMQTHVSYVLLTGDFAYKVKKSVDFGFLNYSTLAKRQHFCAEELRLNQRAASPLYLEVVPIAQQGDRYILGDAEGGEVVEYAVKMRQFPQATLLSHLFEQGGLSQELLRKLAEAIADFHLKAETNDYIREFGTVENVRQSIDENYEQTVGFIGGPQTQQQFDDTKAYTDKFFATQAALLQQRMDQNKIRACHGDLHLNNICYWQDELLLFDCIEFNEPFRFVDVMFDIAYIIMDLTVAGRQDLAASFLSHYVECTGDWEGLQVLPLYVSRQSYVRAKVTSFLLGDPSIDEATKQAASDKAAKYYTLAWSYVQPQAGQLLVMSGLSGAGKSTVAKELSRQLGGIYLRSDAVRKHLAGVPLQERGDDSLYTPAMSQQTYARLTELGGLLASLGNTVILDAKFDRVATRQLAIAQAHAHNVPVTVVHCDAPLAVLEQRVRDRQGDIADATVAVLANQQFEPFTAAEQPYVKRVDTTQPLPAQLATIVEA